MVKVKYNGTVLKEARAWVVWADIEATQHQVGATRGTIGGVTATSLDGGYDFTYEILPATIITDANRPNLSGANASSVPGGSSLSGGANKKWDGSRQKRTKIVNTAGISDTDLTSPAPATITSFPSNDVEGNDDQTTNDPGDE